MEEIYREILNKFKERIDEGKADPLDKDFYETPMIVESLDDLDFIILKNLIKQSESENRHYNIEIDFDSLISKIFTAPGYLEKELILRKIFSFQDVNSVFVKHEDETVSYIEEREIQKLTNIRTSFDDEVESVLYCQLMPYFSCTLYDDSIILQIQISKTYIDNLFNLH